MLHAGQIIMFPIPQIENYEQDRIPEPRQLLRFQRAAQEAGRYDLALTFLDAAQETLGLSGLASVYRPEPLGGGGLASALEGGGRFPGGCERSPHSMNLSRKQQTKYSVVFGG